MPIYKELLFIPILIFFCVKKIIATNYFLLLKILNKTPWCLTSHYMKYKKSYDFSRVLQIYQLFTYIFEISKDWLNF